MTNIHASTRIAHSSSRIPHRSFPRQFTDFEQIMWEEIHRVSGVLVRRYVTQDAEDIATEATLATITAMQRHGHWYCPRTLEEWANLQGHAGRLVRACAYNTFVMWYRRQEKQGISVSLEDLIGDSWEYEMLSIAQDAPLYTLTSIVHDVAFPSLTEVDRLQEVLKHYKAEFTNFAMNLGLSIEVIEDLWHTKVLRQSHPKYVASCLSNFSSKVQEKEYQRRKKNLGRKIDKYEVVLNTWFQERKMCVVLKEPKDAPPGSRSQNETFKDRRKNSDSPAIFSFFSTPLRNVKYTSTPIFNLPKQFPHFRRANA
jgi:hypothetical protein